MQETVNKYLLKLGYANKIDGFNDKYLSHPNYPSLLAVTDSLTQLEIVNVAVNVPFNQIGNLPDVFVTQFIIDDDKEFFIVEKIEDNYFIFYDNHKKNKYQIEEIRNHWTGLVLLLEENDSKNDVEKKSYQYFYFLLFTIGLYSIIEQNKTVYSFLQLLFTVIGLFFSVEITKSIFHNEGLTNGSKFCNKKTNFSCNEIIKSNLVVFKKYFFFVDLPIIFFSFSFLLQILFPTLIIIVGILSLFSIPIVIYSIYYQSYIAKRWCVLCLVISLTLSINTILLLLNFKFIKVESIDVYKSLILLVMVYLFWYSIKSITLKSIILKKHVNSLLRFKRNIEVFEKVSTKVQLDYEGLNLIKLGDDNANNTIVLFISPSCSFCDVAFKESLEIIEKNKNKFNLMIGFNVNINNNENPYVNIAVTIQNLYFLKKDYKNALIDWHIKKLKIEDWIHKWTINNKEPDKILQSHYYWCLDNDLQYTPVRIFNNYLLNENYDLKDIIYFLKD
ncbi:cysteine peptidase family C39 domain-containing protein [Flavobacterium dankookense]|uniref:Peptidase C39-like protein n=1 Tax=Flavobacterium dankookense TaxID=706186 RepID=A0A4R6Q4X4_9FLAO|nr:cysteine peptidase family C39 domain-containing protein [Flavobacterium dankookense]TDP57414.1 peptidase C39-like protein [Flavobacterium dankookense]